MPELLAYRNQVNHRHRWGPARFGIQLCECGAVRTGSPDEPGKPLPWPPGRKGKGISSTSGRK